MMEAKERLPRRQRVLVSGLSARADVNGLFAEVQHFDESAGRYAILVLVTGEHIRVGGLPVLCPARPRGSGRLRAPFPPAPRHTPLS